jgi:NTP pyrophosphatase (non-canonical NTP hydrolase)
MNFSEYQRKALETDQVPGAGEKSLIVPLLGLAGETGSLITEYKKLLRDGPAYRVFDERIAEELGDILWYLANVASKAGMDLQEIAESNLRKVQNRWRRTEEKPLLPGIGQRFYDDTFPPGEQLPRQFIVAIREEGDGKNPTVRISMDGEQLGNQLTDNAYEEDGYRFHDVFHFANAAVLGWSPVARAITKRKRKSNPKIDEVEDGGRAAVIEEAVAALVFDYAKNHSYLREVRTLDYALLTTVKSLTNHLEVATQSLHAWEESILQGFGVWREVVERRGGKILGNMQERSVSYHPL